MSPGGKGQTFDPNDARTSVAQALDEQQRKAWMDKRKQELLASTKGVVNAARAETQETSSTEVIKFVAMAFGVVIVVSLGSVYGIIWALDNLS